MSNATIERCRANVAMLGFLHPAFLLIHARIRDRYRIVTKEQGYGTMAMTSSGSILINEEFAAKLTSDELQGVLAHEMLHLVLMHHSRTGNRDNYIQNVACFTGDTVVGDRYISDIVAGDRVIDASGSTATVTTPMNKPYVGEMFTIKPAYLLPTRATPEHPFLVSKRVGTSNPIALAPPEWVEAQEIKVGDYIYFGRPSTDVECNKLDITKYINSNDRRTDDSVCGFISGMPIDEDIAWLLGLYTAEGDGNSAMRLSLHAEEVSFAQRAIDIVAKYGFSGKYKIDGNGCCVRLGGRFLGHLFQSLCGCGAKNKKIPDFILHNSNKTIRAAYLQGLWDGDGSTWPSRPTSRSISTASKRLAVGVQELLSTLDMMGSVSTIQQKEGRKVGDATLSSGTRYDICWYEGDGYRKSNFAHGGRTTKRRWKQTRYGMAMPVTKVTVEQFSGTVYNMETSSHTYTANGIVVHNCDMVMNDALRKDGIKLPASALYVPQEYTGDMFAEALYEWLVKNPQHLPEKKGCDKCGGTGKKSDGSDCDCDGQGDAAAGCGVVDEDYQNPDKPDWKRIAVEARAHARSAGQGSSAVAALLAPRVAKIDFKKVIRHGFEATSSSRKRDFQTYAKRNRRSPPRGVQLPGWHGQDPSIAVVVDASGSMDREWINIIAAEVISLMRTFSGVKVYLAVHTSELVWAGWLKATDSWKLSEALSFTGGTDPQPAYDAVKFATKGRCDNLLHFTDTEFGDEWPAVPAKHLIVGAFGRNISTKPPAGAQVVFCDMEGRS